MAVDLCRAIDRLHNRGLIDIYANGEHYGVGGSWRPNGGFVGYKAERGNKALTLDQEKATTVRRAFELREAMPNASLQKLADALNNEGHTTKGGKRFYPMQVKRICPDLVENEDCGACELADLCLKFVE